MQSMVQGEGSSSLPEDEIIRLRAKMEDHTYEVVEAGGNRVIAFRVPGEEIDLLESLEYLSEFLSADTLEEATELIIISDRRTHISPPAMLAPKLEEKREDDQRLHEELKEKISEDSEPIVFTTENDILELYRVAIRIKGSMERPDSVIGMEMIKKDIPDEGDVFYLIFDDGYRKMTRNSFESITDRALSSLREGPSFAKDREESGMRKDSSVTKTGKKTEWREKDQKTSTREWSIPGTKESSNEIEDKWKQFKNPLKDLDPDVMLRDFIRNMSSLGYREDTKFSRHDAHQTFLVGLSGPTVFYKILIPGEDIRSFTRVLEHRSDALGVLVEKSWSPGLEAISRIEGFIYLTGQRANRAHEVVDKVRKGGV